MVRQSERRRSGHSGGASVESPRPIHHSAAAARGERSAFDEFPQPGRRLGGKSYSGLGEQLEREPRTMRNYRRCDRRVYEDACERLRAQTRVDLTDVSVQVSDGLVTLEGSVPERWMKRAAEDSVADIRGVVDVENRLITGGTGDTSESGASHWRKVSGL